jgi:hypothetical protein
VVPVLLLAVALFSAVIATLFAWGVGKRIASRFVALALGTGVTSTTILGLGILDAVLNATVDGPPPWAILLGLAILACLSLPFSLLTSVFARDFFERSAQDK